MSECFTCPGGHNYAAIALQMQDTARRAEECLYQLELSLRAATSPPSLVYEIFSPLTIPAVPPSVETDLVSNVGSPIFANTQLEFFALGDISRAGVWVIGANVHLTATGAVTAGSFRHLGLRVTGDPLNFLGDEKVKIIASVIEPNNGLGVDITASTVVGLEDNDKVQFTLLHNNASSLTINAGSRFWMTRLSDRNAVKVVA